MKPKFIKLGFGLIALTIAVMGAAPESVGPTDSQIGAIVIASNQVDIDAGGIAKNSANKEVQRFAKNLIAGHSSMNERALALLTKLHITLEETPRSKTFRTGGKKNIAHLLSLQGEFFDRAYVDHEVFYHQQVLATLKNVLIPAAKNPELIAFLVKLRPFVEAQLKQAQAIQASMI